MSNPMLARDPISGPVGSLWERVNDQQFASEVNAGGSSRHLETGAPPERRHMVGLLKAGEEATSIPVQMRGELTHMQAHLHRMSLQNKCQWRKGQNTDLYQGGLARPGHRHHATSIAPLAFCTPGRSAPRNHQRSST